MSESITVHATDRGIHIPGEHLRTLLSSHKVADDIITGCEIALHELLVNLVDLAYEGNEDGLIMVNITCNRIQILIETHDTGKPIQIDFGKILLPPPPRKEECGCGVVVKYKPIDEAKFKTENGKNIWQLVKKL